MIYTRVIVFWSMLIIANIWFAANHFGIGLMWLVFAIISVIINFGILKGNE